MGYQPRKKRGPGLLAKLIKGLLTIFVWIFAWLYNQAVSRIYRLRQSPEELEFRELIDFVFEIHREDESLTESALQDVHKAMFDSPPHSQVLFDTFYDETSASQAQIIVLWPYIFCINNLDNEIKYGALIHNPDFEWNHRHGFQMGDARIKHSVNIGRRDPLYHYDLDELYEYLFNPFGDPVPKPSYLIEDTDLLDRDVLIEVLQSYKDQYEAAYRARKREEEECQNRELREQRERDVKLFEQQKVSMTNLLSESCMATCPDCDHLFVLKKKDQSVPHIQCKKCESILSYSADLQEVESVTSGVVEPVLVTE